MSTVKDFKDLDVEFIVGDEYAHSNSLDIIMCADNISLAWFERGSIESQSAIVCAFAWRPLNTLPNNPKFKYEKSEFDSFWRPLLDQSTLNPVNDAAVVKPSDDKPVFTQEIGIDSVVTVNTVNGMKNGVVIGVFDRWYWVDVIGVGLKTYDRFLVSHLDTCTPKQKAVDEALEVIGIKSVEGGNARRWLDMLYDADKLKC